MYQEGPTSGSAAARGEGSLLEGQDGGGQQGASMRKPGRESVSPLHSLASLVLPLGLFRGRGC